MVYNQTMLQEAKTMYDLMNYANYVTGDILYIAFVTAIFFISIMSLRRYGIENALMISGFFTFILTAIMTSVGLISVYLSLIFGIITAGTYFYSVTIGD